MQDPLHSPIAVAFLDTRGPTGERNAIEAERLAGLMARIRTVKSWSRALFLIILASCGASSVSSDVKELLQAVIRERFVVARLAGQDAWQACLTTDSSRVIPRMRCGSSISITDPRVQRIGELDRAVRRAASVDSSAAALGALGLVSIRWPDTTSSGADRAVVALEQARRRANGDPSILNDLAAAYFALAERTQRLIPMLRGLDAIEQAVTRDSTRPEILFNRALILERLYLVASAESAWARYVRIERQADWRAEGEAHRQRLAAATDAANRAELADSLVGDPDALRSLSLDAAVHRSPQAVREFGLRLLGEWGRAVGDGQASRAAGLLAAAHDVGRALEVGASDRGFARIVSYIDAAASQPARFRPLAHAHALLGAGVRLYSRDSAAGPPLDSADRALRGLGSPAVRWASFYRAAVLVAAGRYAEADELLAGARRAAPSDEPALIGKSLMGLGVSQVRRGNYELATSLYGEAAPFMSHGVEREHAGLRSYLLAESLGLAGQTSESYEEAYRGLRLLSPFRRSNYLNNHLRNVALVARSNGLSHAALAILNEQIVVARAVNKPDVLALVFAARATDLASVGRPREADVALAEAAAWATRITGDRPHARLRAILSLRRGQIGLGDPNKVLAVLASAVDSLRPFETDLYLPTALYQAALAARRVDQSAMAHDWLVEAIDRIERQHAVFTSTVDRAAFSETVENVFDAMIDLARHDNRMDAAFEYLERGRVAAWPAAERQRAASTTDGGSASRAAVDVVQNELPPDMALVEYAMTSDSVVAFVVSRRIKREYTLARRDSVVALIDRLPSALRFPDAGPSDPRAQLFDLLLRPLWTDLDGIRRIAIVPDRELYRVPFVALWDRDSRRYAIESFEFRTVPSAAFLLAALRRHRTAERDAQVLVIGNPDIDTALARQLPALRGAGREADSIASLYPRRARLLTGPSATREKVLEYLPGSSIIHFAGHAIFNNVQPDLSYLALAGGGGSAAGSEGVLRAREIGDLRLSNTQVVVLSACSTLNPRSSRMGAMAGLAFSFLRAGVPSTISTLWDISDDATTPLLVDFHRRLSTHEAAPEALRQAQMNALKSSTPHVRAPYTWAAFTYTGP